MKFGISFEMFLSRKKKRKGVVLLFFFFKVIKEKGVEYD